MSVMTDSDDINAIRLGERIRIRRDRLGLTGEELGKRMGLAAGSIYANEHGRRPSRRSKALYERELLWRVGSCDLVLEGGEPIELPEPSARAIDVAPGVRIWIDEFNRLDETQQRRALRQALAAVRAELDDSIIE